MSLPKGATPIRQDCLSSEQEEGKFRDCVRVEGTCVMDLEQLNKGHRKDGIA